MLSRGIHSLHNPIAIPIERGLDNRGELE